MNDDDALTSSTGQSASSTGAMTPGSHRKERGAIAAQACDTCRSRKQRCDEQRPKCGTCQKFKLECNYREPQPTKKDRTLMEILDRIKSLEGKVDGLSLRASFQPPMPNLGSTTAPTSMSPSIDPPTTSSFQPSVVHSQSMDPPSATSGNEDTYLYVSAVHQMMGWPAMQRLLESIKDEVPGLDPSTIDSEGTSIVLGMHEHNRRVPLSADGTEGQMKTMAPLSGQVPGVQPLTISTLTWDTMQRLSKAYFDSINFLFPLVDRQVFNTEVMPSLVRSGFSESMASTIALLVFALGELVIAGTEGIPINVYNGRQSGLRGGTAREPPGLALFNEARKRMGFNLTDCSIENIQVYALSGIYFGACGHNSEQWRMTTNASLAVQAVISSQPSALQSPNGDIIRRAFWYCLMMETCIILELGLPTTGLEKMERDVGLPDFSESFAEEDYIGNQSTHFQEHFASQIVLRRLMMDFHQTMSQTSPTTPGSGSPTFSPGHHPSTPSGGGTSFQTIKSLGHQLDQWRGMLPVPLRWDEDTPGAFPTPAGADSHHPPLPSLPSPPSLPGSHHRSASSSKQRDNAPQNTRHLMFTTDLDAPPRPYPYAYDIQVALMRTRYYYAKYLLHRPFVHRALHNPDSMTADDATGAAACLRAALKWPVTMSPTCHRKRLIPCLYFWTQNVLGVLLMLHVARTDPMLQKIVQRGLCGKTWEIEALETVGLYIDWLRDLKDADPAAGFGWKVVKALYGLDEDEIAE